MSRKVSSPPSATLVSCSKHSLGSLKSRPFRESLRTVAEHFRQTSLCDSPSRMMGNTTALALPQFGHVGLNLRGGGDGASVPTPSLGSDSSFMTGFRVGRECEFR